VLGVGLPPSRELVHASATVSRRFITWLKKACKNYEALLKLEAVVDNRLRKERLEQLTGAAKTALTEAIMEYEKVQAHLKRLYESEAMKTFMGSDEGLLKWIGDEALSLGYTGTREKSAQYWLWDVTSGSRADEIPLPPNKKIRDILNFYNVESYYVFRVPTQQEAETELLSFLENVKKWPRERLIWLLRNVYSLDGGGFYVTARKVIDLVSLRDVWEDMVEDWKRAVEDALKKTPQYEVLKTVLGSDWEAEKYLRDLTKDVETEFLEKYGNLTADIGKVKEEFYDRAVALLRERVAPEEKMREVYEQIKPLVPADKVELTRAGLWKAIRWAYLHPQWSVDVFASGQIWPLGVFTTEQAKAVATKILEKVGIKPVTRVKLTGEESARLADYFSGMLRTYGVSLPTQYKSEFEKALDVNKTYEQNLPLIKKAAEDILKKLMPDLVKIAQEALAELEAL